MTAVSPQLTLDATLATLEAKLTPDAMEQIGSVYAFHFKDLAETHTLDASGRAGQGWLRSAPEANQLVPNFTVTISSNDFADLVAGRLHPMAGMATGRMKLQGNIKEALKLDRLLKS
jgi:putative sterol carrier protein